MYQTLYRKYRPRSFSDVCGQTRITTVLRHQVSEGTLTHAYLFCGTRGTGKTTCAKILAKVANCLNPQNGEPCNACDNCLAADRGELLDILEVDAASNTGVENIRRLCEELNFLPAQGKKRVYIIDEVHMLSIGAFNALLKTLEEPPAHALFILATTELHKVPATVRSRCQCFTFHRISVDDIAARVMHVSKEESIPLNESGARLIARLADGAMRDALSLLELCVGQTVTLDEETLDRLFGLGDGEVITDLALSGLKGDLPRCLELLDQLYQSMGDLKEVLLQVLGAYRDMLMFRADVQFETVSNRTAAQQNQLSDAAKRVSESKLLFAVGAMEDALMKFERLTVNKKTLCEMAFFTICTPAVSISDDAVSARIEALEAKLKAFEAAPRALPSADEVKKEADLPPPLTDDDLPWAVDEPAEDVQSAFAKTAIPVAPPVQAKPQQSEGCSYADALLKKLGANDPMFASFYSNLSLDEEDGVLSVYGEAFTIMMLMSREKEVLDSAKSFSDTVREVRFVEGKPAPKKKKIADLGEF